MVDHQRAATKKLLNDWKRGAIAAGHLASDCFNVEAVVISRSLERFNF